MTKGFVIGTGCLLAGATIAILVYDGVHATQLENRQEESVMDAIRSPVDWPGQELDDDPAFQQFGELYANVSTNWESDETGDGELSYAVSLTPATLPSPAMLVQLAKNCRFSLTFNDSQGMLVTTIPLEVTPTPGANGSVASLNISDTTPMAAAAYADMIGAHADAESGTLEGSAEIAGECDKAAVSGRGTLPNAGR